MSEEFDKSYWEGRYRGHAGVRVMRPNPQLVTEAGELAPGKALDAGCGEGADACWLASRGWLVTAVDISGTALGRARDHAETFGPDIAGRIEWVEADLTGWTPAEGHFDLVATHYVHVAGSRESLFRRLAAAVAPGGTLLIVGHDPSDQHTADYDVHFTAGEIAGDLDPDRWEIVVAETRSRPATGHGSQDVTLRDAVLRARRRVAG